MSQDKPNVFIVGQPKSGTSALFSFLKEHPEVCVCATKEPQYFCKDINSQYFHLAGKERTVPNYLALFERCTGHKVILEASTAYLYSRVAAEEIRRFNPEARIIMMLREPVDFLFAYHMQMLRTSCKFEEEMDFMAAMQLEDERRAGRSIPRDCFDPQFLHYSARAAYTEQIERYLGAFPPDQVRIVIYDDFKANNQAVYDEIVSFLGIDPAFRPEFKTVNVKVGIRFRSVKQTSDRLLFPIKQAIRPLVSDGFYKSMRGVYRRMFFKSKGLPTLRQTDKRLLMTRYKHEIVRLSKLLDRDLVTLWGYDGL